MIDLAQRAGVRYDADRETPPRIDGSVLYTAIWRVYLAARAERIVAAITAQERRHTR